MFKGTRARSQGGRSSPRASALTPKSKGTYKSDGWYCDCDKPAVKFQCKKEGHNRRGDWFFKCAKAQSPTEKHCNFFMWEKDAEMRMGGFGGASARAPASTATTPAARAHSASKSAMPITTASATAMPATSNRSEAAAPTAPPRTATPPDDEAHKSPSKRKLPWQKQLDAAAAQTSPPTRKQKRQMMLMEAFSRGAPSAPTTPAKRKRSPGSNSDSSDYGLSEGEEELLASVESSAKTSQPQTPRKAQKTSFEGTPRRPGAATTSTGAGGLPTPETSSAKQSVSRNVSFADVVQEQETPTPVRFRDALNDDEGLFGRVNDVLRRHKVTVPAKAQEELRNTLAQEEQRTRGKAASVEWNREHTRALDGKMSRMARQIEELKAQLEAEKALRRR